METVEVCIHLCIQTGKILEILYLFFCLLYLFKSDTRKYLSVIVAVVDS